MVQEAFTKLLEVNINFKETDVLSSMSEVCEKHVRSMLIACTKLVKSCTKFLNIICEICKMLVKSL